MSNEQWKQEVLNYITETRFAILSYVREDNVPVLRSMGSFVPSGLDIYFSTKKSAAKVQGIEKNKQVSFFFEHDNQTLDSWKSVLLIGEAAQVEQESELNKAVALLSDRSPRFKERIANGDLPNTAIFKITAREVEYLDYSKGPGFVQKFKL
ncbi:MAG TPA: pyridoxamine 5'-phosphate oxidase family protein [Methylomusa anaerophila]|uniref:Pyridoxamine 5'-phosphate oxidase n=1 Tax=Methylomusa anaerophila TaxID=1930071 RepID=A0A348AEN1_9FIRM|nr:pyridoxamine 5'-phosphate oxidase family protein [Methylomusa anaerophila]BBB89529.1 pyridoxamine 5'-phosphate oxidase [Methylomusa anaerophila]HML90101.1 pyridoxamine 5'-phosphate oxidase family protein [Methylomusa anaerophila]